MPRHTAPEDAARRTRWIASALTTLPLLAAAACLGPALHGDEPPAASGQAVAGPGGYRLFVGIVGNPSVPDISWSDEELTQIKQLGVNMVQLSIAWGGKPAGEVLNLEDLNAEQREKFKFRIAQAKKHGLKTIAHFGIPRMVNFNPVRPACILDQAVQTKYRDLLKEFMVSFPEVDDVLVYTFDQQAWLCSEFGPCPRCSGIPLDARLPAFLDMLNETMQSVRPNTRLWWNAQAGSAGGRVLMDGSTLQPAAPGGAAGAATSRFPEVAHPCMHGGYSAPYKRLVQGGIAPEPPVVQLLGVPNFNACMALGERLVRLANASCPPNRQATAASCILGALQPPMSGVFTAITGAGAARYYCCQDIELACATVVWVQASPKRAVIRSPASTRLPIPAVAGFYVVSAFLHVPPDASSQALIPAARRLCSQPWSRVKAEMGGALNAERFCTWGGYTAALLSHGLRLGAAGRVTFGRGDMGWPLGAALLEASRLPGFMADGGRIGSPISGAWGQAGPRQSSTGGGGWWSGPVWQLTLLVAASVMGAWLALRPRLLAVQPGRAPSAVRPRMLSATGLPVFSAAPRKAAAA